MVTNNTNIAPLLPDRHPQAELFLCDITDAALKSDMASMEHPIFSLTKKPDMAVRRYEHGANWLEVTPSGIGLATILDRDILIFAVSQIMAARKEGRPYSQYVAFTARDFLIFANRKTDGRAYASLKDALTRLSGTLLTTNVKTGSVEQTDVFGLIDSATIRRETLDGRIVEWGVKLSDWLFSAIQAEEVLTLHPDYFRLRKPLEKRVYEIARKHCGNQQKWKVGIELLQKKCGSNSPKKHFRYMLSALIENDHLPDYAVSLEKDMVIFTNRRVQLEIAQAKIKTDMIRLSGEAHLEAKIVAPGWDTYFLEEQWRSWLSMVDEPPRNPDKAFIGFCRKWFERRGEPR